MWIKNVDWCNYMYQDCCQNDQMGWQNLDGEQMSRLWSRSHPHLFTFLSTIEFLLGKETARSLGRYAQFLVIQSVLKLKMVKQRINSEV